jgi:triphosphoribosyl-dephospho-CoA synthase
VDRKEVTLPMSAPHTIGSLAQLACTWEVLARKAGNVCPGREFPDLTVNDFLLSAAAVAPVLDEAPRQPLGVTILRCIEETRKVVDTNTNLGIVLLLVPLASVPLDVPLRPSLERLLMRTTVEDSRNVYAAIRLAKPGGLGEVHEQDVRDEPTLPLRDVMALAAAHDSIASEYQSGFRNTEHFRAHFAGSITRYQTIEHAIVRLQLEMLASGPLDSLVVRKRGEEIARLVSGGAFHTCFGRFDFPGRHQIFLDLDAWLRSDNHARNPGTTADLIAAALFVALRENLIAPDMPFHWHGHPFEQGA